MDRIKGMLDSLSELDDQQVIELQGEIVSEFETVEKQDPTPQTVDAMTSLADMLDTVRGEVKRREAAAQELTARAAEATMRVKGEDDMNEEVPTEAPTSEDEAKEAPETEAAAEAQEATAELAEHTPAAEEAPVVEAEEAPADEATETPADEEEEAKKKKEALMSEASTSVETASELSTDETATTTVEAPAVAELAADEATTTAEATPAAELATEEVPAADAVVEAPVAEVAPAAEAVVASTESTPTEAQTVQEDQEAPVTAAVNEPDAVFEAPADRRPVAQASVAPVAITAGADIPGYTAGSSISDMKEVASAMSKRLHTLRRVNGGDGEQHIVASVTTQYPEARVLTTDAESNWDKIQSVVGPEALVASGGHQAPFEVKYDIFGMGTAVRPVRDALPRFQADRGGIRYIVPPVLSDYANAVGIWTAANDSAQSPSPSAKLSLTVTAATETTVATDAVTLQLQFGNLLTRAYPELIARHNELGLIQHAREAEGQILSKIADASTAVTTSSVIGVGRDFLVQLGRAAAAYRSRHRLEADAPLRAIIPAWVKDVMAADLTLSMPGDSTMNAYAEIEGFIAARGINITWTIDGSAMTDVQQSGSLNGFADTFDWFLFSEGTFLFLDGGTLDLGIIRDSTLVGTNDYKMFVETFEGVAKVGVESLKIKSTINVNGVTSASYNTLTGVSGAGSVEY